MRISYQVFSATLLVFLALVAVGVSVIPGKAQYVPTDARSGLDVLGEKIYSTTIDFAGDGHGAVQWVGGQPVVLNGKAEAGFKGGFNLSLNDAPGGFFTVWEFIVGYEDGLPEMLVVTGREMDRGFIEISFGEDGMNVSASLSTPSENSSPVSTREVPYLQGIGCPADGMVYLKLLYHTPTGSIAVSCNEHLVGVAHLGYSFVPGNLVFLWKSQNITFDDIEVNVYDLATSRQVFRAGNNGIDLGFAILYGVGHDGSYIVLTPTSEMAFYKPGSANAWYTVPLDDVYRIIDTGDIYYIVGPTSVEALDPSSASPRGVEGYHPWEAVQDAGLPVLDEITEPISWDLSPSGKVAYEMASLGFYAVNPSTGMISLQTFVIHTLSIIDGYEIRTPLLVSVFSDIEGYAAQTMRAYNTVLGGDFFHQNAGTVTWLDDVTVAMLIPSMGLAFTYNTSSNVIGVLHLDETRMILDAEDEYIVLLTDGGLVKVEREHLISSIEPLASLPYEGDFIFVNATVNGRAPEGGLAVDAIVTIRSRLSDPNSTVAWSTEITWTGVPWNATAFMEFLGENITVFMPDSGVSAISTIVGVIAAGDTYYVESYTVKILSSTPYWFVNVYRFSSAEPQARLRPVCNTSVPPMYNLSIIPRYTLLSPGGFSETPSGPLMVFHLINENSDPLVGESPPWTQSIIGLEAGEDGYCTPSLLSLAPIDYWFVKTVDGRLYALYVDGDKLVVEESGRNALAFPSHISLSGNTIIVRTISWGGECCLIVDLQPECREPGVFQLERGILTFYVPLEAGKIVTYEFRVALPSNMESSFGGQEDSAGTGEAGESGFPGWYRWVLAAVIVSGVAAWLYLSRLKEYRGKGRAG